MQEVDVTPQLLIEFSTEYAKVPIVELDKMPVGIPFTHHVLACWLLAIQRDDDNSIYQVFTGWLCGRGHFLHPDVPGKVIMLALADALSEVVHDKAT